MVIRRFLLPAMLLLAAAGCADTATDPDNTSGLPPRVGDIAPNFTQNDTSGNAVSLSAFRGKVVLLDFWATWCGPCVRVEPELKDIWGRHKAENFMIVSVSLDYDLGSWRTFISENKLDWAHVADAKGWNNAVAQRYGVTAIPQMYLIGTDGKILSEGLIIGDSTIAAALR